ncbi:hypothetical protein PsorP6_010410 [Peronosclerospora sorghi]|uniref:Uncharacterized protein n=1 Tax=Peronosclerospora sorghi TaxID=230839 RepID=A0ACC0VVI1_9STRA|nr:hypothetical protein PsorP6_010410 [Peronosclerospora sorghi]
MDVILTLTEIAFPFVEVTWTCAFAMVWYLHRHVMGISVYALRSCERWKYCIEMWLECLERSHAAPTCCFVFLSPTRVGLKGVGTGGLAVHARQGYEGIDFVNDIHASRLVWLLNRCRCFLCNRANLIGLEGSACCDMILPAMLLSFTLRSDDAPRCITYFSMRWLLVTLVDVQWVNQREWISKRTGDDLHALWTSAE